MNFRRFSVFSALLLIFLAPATAAPVFASTTNNIHVVATVNVGTGPAYLSSGSSNKNVYVPNYRSDTVSVISGATNKVIATINIGSHAQPSFVLYDPANKELYVTNNVANTVSVISGATNKVIHTIALWGIVLMMKYTTQQTRTSTFPISAEAHSLSQ